MRLAAARWLGGFGTPPPPRLAGWLVRPRKTANIRRAPLYRTLVTHGMGMGMGLQGWGRTLRVGTSKWLDTVKHKAIQGGGHGTRVSTFKNLGVNTEKKTQFLE